MLITALLGIASSIVSEIITWINKKLFGTFLQGQGALLLSVVMALIAGLLKVFVFTQGMTIANWQEMLAAFVTAFGWSQLWFKTIVSWIGLKVQDKKQTYDTLA